MVYFCEVGFCEHLTPCVQEVLSGAQTHFLLKNVNGGARETKGELPQQAAPCS